MKKEKSAAVLTVREPGKFTKRGARDVAAWLRRLAKDVETLHAKMGGTFRARYIYTEC